MTNKLFKRHNVVNVYFEGENLTYDEKIDERLSFKGYLWSKLVSNCDYSSLFGNYYNFPYDNKNAKTSNVYIKIGIRYLFTRNQLMKIIKGYTPKNNKIKLRFHEFKLKNSHYTIESLKFAGYACATVCQNVVSDRKFRNNILRRFNSLSGDKLTKSQKNKLMSGEWLNMIHHMFLSLNIDYDEEALIYGLGKERIQFNLNKTN